MQLPDSWLEAKAKGPDKKNVRTRGGANPFRGAFICAMILVAAAGAITIAGHEWLPENLSRYTDYLPVVVSVGALLFLWRRFTPLFAAAMGEYSSLSVLKNAQLKVDALSLPGKVERAPDTVKISKDAKGTLDRTDYMTKLSNKLRMIEKFYRLSESEDFERRTFTVGLVNLDGMKPINDLYGRAAGNEIIKQCALRLAAAVEEDGFIYRYEGDEFSFIFPNLRREEDVEQKGELLQDVLLAPFDLEGSTVRLSGSFGFAVFPHAGSTFDTVMANAETALYHSKRNGRGRVTVYTNQVEEETRETARMEQALRRAVAQHHVVPHFQPIISLADGKLLGFEALARWTDEELGVVSPGKFIPLAEERGIIAAMTNSLLHQAAGAASDWPNDMFLSFNLSSTQLVDLSTAGNIKRIATEAGLPLNRLEIEVTETAIMSDPQTAALIIDELHESGIRVSMDDFGTGQSSLGRLRELKLDKVKIDRDFIKAIGEDRSAEHIIRAILEMCEGLGLTVVAEGIEMLHQAESLKRFGCHAAQGFLFGRPQDALRTRVYIRHFIEQLEQDASEPLLKSA